jgi:hypothetical protein
VTAAIAGGSKIFIVEGEKCADTLLELGVPATTNRGGANKWHPELNKYFVGADAILIPDNDDAGHKHVQEIGAALTGIASRIRVLVLPCLPPKGDVADWLVAGGTREALDKLVSQASDWQPPMPAADKPDAKTKAEADEQGLIDNLARLGRLEYEQRRSEAAKGLGIRRGALDEEVKARRAERRAQSGPPPLFGHWEVEPWPEEVDTDALLLSLKRRVQRHAILSNEAATVVALWVLFAWAHDTAAVHSPILRVTSPEANSGKTTLLSVVAFLVPRALLCVEISEATLFRGVELWQPTIIVDEADVILVNNEPLRAVVNSGWTRGAVVPRCIGDEKTPHAFPTFCPKALGMKGRKLLDTTLSRCIDPVDHQQGVVGLRRVVSQPPSLVCAGRLRPMPRPLRRNPWRAHRCFHGGGACQSHDPRRPYADAGRSGPTAPRAVRPRSPRRAASARHHEVAGTPISP